MPIEGTPEQWALRKELGKRFKAQTGWADWGLLTAHAVICYRNEIERLRNMLKDSKLDAGAWTDPLDEILR